MASCYGISPQPTTRRYRGIRSGIEKGPGAGTNIHRIGFIPVIQRRTPGSLDLASIFPWERTEQFWASLEEALRLVTRARSIALLGVTLTYRRSGFPPRFTDIIMDVFVALRIENLHAYLPPNRLFQICQAWPSLTTLRAKKLINDTFVDLPPDALPRLRHLEQIFT